MKQPVRIGLSRPLILAGRNRSYTMTGPAGPDPAVKAQWSQFMSDFGKIEGQVGFKAYGVCHSFDAAQKLMDYMCAIEVADAAEVPNYLFTLTIPARRTAVFLHEGDVAHIAQTWEIIFSTWLPAAKLEVAQGAQFEVYDEDGGSGVEIHIPVK